MVAGWSGWPSSMERMASKWLRVGSGEPQAWTNASPPDWNGVRSPDALGFSPK